MMIVLLTFIRTRKTSFIFLFWPRKGKVGIPVRKLECATLATWFCVTSSTFASGIQKTCLRDSEVASEPRSMDSPCSMRKLLSRRQRLDEGSRGFLMTFVIGFLCVYEAPQSLLTGSTTILRGNGAFRVPFRGHIISRPYCNGFIFSFRIWILSWLCHDLRTLGRVIRCFGATRMNCFFLLDETALDICK